MKCTISVWEGTMLNLKRWTAAVLCAALGLGLSACTLKTPANVMTVDGRCV